jgi:hypothetical protein
MGRKMLARLGVSVFAGFVVLASSGATAGAGPIGLAKTLKVVPGDPGLNSSTLACPRGVSPLNGSCVLMGVVLSGFVTSGGEWMITKAVPGDEQSLSAQGVTLYPEGVSCPTETTCVVAGGLHTGLTVLAWFTNGALTKTVVVPASNKVVVLAISCPNSNLCVAVGRAPVGTNSFVTQGVVVVARNTVVGSPRRVAGTSTLDAVACGASSSCLAVGVGGSFRLVNGQPEFTASESATYGKIGATVQLSNAAPGAAKILPSLTKLTAVSCGSASSCTALGENKQDVSVVLQLHGGAAGPLHALPPSDAGGDISCFSPSLCVAVASSQATSNHPHGLVLLVDGGAVTSTYTLPVPISVDHISCPVASYCLVEGDFGPFPGAPGTLVVAP